MERFQPGERVYIRLRIQNEVPIKNAILVFVHEEDENEHVVFGFKTDPDLPVVPNRERLIDTAVMIEKGKKPGVYALDKINFETFGGSTLDHDGTIAMPRFEVIPEKDKAPLVKEVSVFTEMHWSLRRLEKEERRREGEGRPLSRGVGQAEISNEHRSLRAHLYPVTLLSVPPLVSLHGVSRVAWGLPSMRYPTFHEVSSSLCMFWASILHQLDKDQPFPRDGRLRARDAHDQPERGGLEQGTARLHSFTERVDVLEAQHTAHPRSRQRRVCLLCTHAAPSSAVDFGVAKHPPWHSSLPPGSPQLRGCANRKTISAGPLRSASAAAVSRHAKCGAP